MPLLHNKHQPFFADPDSPNNFSCGVEQYCHPFNGGDTFMTQFYQTPCNNNEVIDPEFDDYVLSSEIITNGDFATDPTVQWSLGSGVTWDNVNFRVAFSNVNGNALRQSSLSLSANVFYEITFDMSRTSGSFIVSLGEGDPNETNSATFDTTGSHSVVLPFYATGTETITFVCTNFNGWIDNVSVKEIGYTYWNPNGGWLLQDGFACHIEGQTGDLKDTNTDYVIANGYYVGSITVTDYVQGSVDFYIGDVLAGTIQANGTYTYYVTPTLNGTIQFFPTSDFVGCLSNPSVYELRNDYTADIIDSNGNEYDISQYFEYYNEFVTLKFDFASVGNYELPTGCYSVKVYDQCLIESNNLVFNGDFVNGYTDWTRNNGTSQYDLVTNQLQFKFSPFTQGYTDYVTNGDFSSGSGWTLNAGWSVVGGKAVHTPGNTGTLFQTMTLPTPPPTQNYNYWVGFKVTNWTTGTITCKLGNAVNGTTYTWKGNDTFIQIYQPKQSGSVDIVFTPSSTFDGEVDDVKVVLTSGHTAFPIITNINQPLFTTGTYQTEWEIIGSSDANISVRFYLQNATPITTYESTAGVHSFTQSYNLNGGNVIGVANFGKQSIDYIQTNYVVGDITIDNVSVVKVEPFEATYQSECLSYNENGWDKTKMIVAYCDQPSFGFEFANTGFKLQQRCLIRSINPNYPKEKTIQKMGNGDARVVYAEIEKFWEVHTDFASETFHDCLSVQIDCDHFGIGDTEQDFKEYIADAESYQPNWNGDGAYSLATSVINLRVKDKGQLFNRHI